jgi:site-specific DNA recombinase
MRTPHAAMYARVSSEQQPMAHTIASQVAALWERVTTDGLARPERMPLLDEGSRGAPWVRPALERLRELMATGAVDRLAGPAPERLARTYASQVLLVEECQRMGVAIIGLNRALGCRPADELLRQGHGRMAE